jgi:hypothetical protein
MKDLDGFATRCTGGWNKRARITIGEEDEDWKTIVTGEISHCIYYFSSKGKPHAAG